MLPFPTRHAAREVARSKKGVFAFKFVKVLRIFGKSQNINNLSYDNDKRHFHPLKTMSLNLDSQHSLVSVIIPTYNRPNYLIQAIASVVQQTYKNIEIIVRLDTYFLLP